jgi:peptide methionine sulfoxide reductase MsrB
MIRETVEIQCNRCGRHQEIQRMIVYRISGLMPSFVQELETAGWKFERDDEYKLTRVLCWHCAGKEK